MNSTIERIVGGAEKLPNKDAGVIRVDDAAFRLCFKIKERNTDGHPLTVDVKGDSAEQASYQHQAFGHIEVARLENRGSGSLAKSWQFSTPDYVVKVGSAIIYCSAAKLDMALAVAKGQVQAKGWVYQPITWYSLDGNRICRDLLFLNMTRHRHVPPAKWFLHRPDGFRFSKAELNPEDIALGFVRLEDRIDVFGRHFCRYGKIERYGGGSFVINDMTENWYVVKDWLSEKGWKLLADEKVAMRDYPCGDHHFVTLATQAVRQETLFMSDYERSHNRPHDEAVVPKQSCVLRTQAYACAI